jgi:hypothetical protein
MHINGTYHSEVSLNRLLYSIVGIFPINSAGFQHCGRNSQLSIRGLRVIQQTRLRIHCQHMLSTHSHLEKIISQRSNLQPGYRVIDW